VIPYGRQHVDDDDIRAVVDVLRGPLLTQGPVVDEFERAVAAYVGARYAVAVASGTAALHIASVAAGIDAGSELITSPITFVATANAALYASGRPAFADIMPDTVNLSPEALSAAIKEHPAARVVIPVHFAGLPCDMAVIKAVADQAGLFVIEDAAHALGASYADGSRVGSCLHSLMTIFSLHPVKPITAGEGGLITTNDEETYRRLLRLRSHGINKLDDPILLPEQAIEAGLPNPWYYEMQELGYHYRITDIQCALGLTQLAKLDRFLARRRELVRVYDEAFAGFAGCRPAQCDGRDRSAHHIYVLRVDFEGAGITRARLMRELRARKIVTQVHYIPVPMHPYYQRLGFRPQDYPNALGYYSEAITIPLFYDLTDAQQGYVIDVLAEYLR
jgi:perosamine synthetase